MRNWRTAHNRRKSLRRLCRAIGHSSEFGYGFAFGGGLGGYEYCGRCNAFLNKWMDEDDE